MINFDNNTGENKTEQNPKWSHILDLLYRIFIVPGSGARKKSALIYFINEIPNIKKKIFT